MMKAIPYLYRIPYNKYSIRGRTRDAYTTESRITLNLNAMYESMRSQYPEYKREYLGEDAEIYAFMCYVSATEAHEIGHFFNIDIGCDEHDDGVPCPWCEEADIIFRWMLW